MSYTFRALTTLTFVAGSALAQGTGDSQRNNAARVSPSVEARVKALHALLDEQCEYVLRTSPEFDDFRAYRLPISNAGIFPLP